MIEIRSQSDLDSYITNGFPNNEMICIYALPNGERYRISSEITLNSNSHLKGINMPRIEWTSDVPSGQTKGMFNVFGSAVSLAGNNSSVVIEGLYLIGRSSTGTLCGIIVDKSGYGRDPFSDYDFDKGYRGKDNVSAIGTTIKNCVIDGFREGIKMSSSVFGKVVGNIVKNCSTYGMNLSSVMSTIFTRNVIEFCPSESMRCLSVLSCVIKNNIVQNCGMCPKFDMASKNVINSNTFSNNNSGMLVSGGQANAITSNRIINNKKQLWSEGAITVDYYSRMHSIHGNQILNNEGYGIYLMANNYTGMCTITGNAIMYNNMNPIKIMSSESGYSVMYANILSNNTIASNSIAGSGNVDTINMTTNMT